MNVIMYIGLGINIAGALLLVVYAINYYKESKEANRLNRKSDELKTGLASRRGLSIVLMTIGWIVMLLGAFYS